MADVGMLYTAPMVRGILSGMKTQTRRLVKCSLPIAGVGTAADWDRWKAHPKMATPDIVLIGENGRPFSIPCRYGRPGGRIWVRETCRAHEITTAEAKADTWKLGDRLGEASQAGLDGVVYLADNTFRAIDNSREASDRWCELNAYRGKRGAVVPAIHMPRWASRITLEVTGVRVERLQDITRGDAMAEGCPFPNMARGDDPRKWYRDLWEQINGAGSWDANPWVWVVTFRKAA